VLLVGATSSVATDLARLLIPRGARFFLMARSREKLARLEAELGAAVLGAACLDFTALEATEQATAAALRAHGPFELAVVAHGDLGDQKLSEQDLAEATRIVAANFTSALAVLLPVSAELEARGHGQLVVITSVAGERGRPRNYTYGAAKGALSLYLEGLRSRLYGRVTVTTIKLGPVDTPMTRRHEKNRLFLSSPEAARGILRAIDARRGVAFVPGFFRWILWLVRALPEPLFQRVRAFSGPPDAP
jgi:short-subunit dehydrogenase